MADIYAFQSKLSGVKLGKICHPTCTLVCEACREDKHNAIMFGNNAKQEAIKLSEIAHSNVCGHTKAMLIQTRCFVAFIDDLSINVWILS